MEKLNLQKKLFKKAWIFQITLTPIFLIIWPIFGSTIIET